ncbi:MAG: helix-turn-helix domain-containing protein [Eubacterium sp.]|nr:helix-turn-helix domain-containing protein [Eubacterium sp.]
MDTVKIETLSKALEYIDSHLTDDFSQKDCAKAAMCSLSGLQKLFKYVFHISIGDYVTRRRMTRAARELLGGRSVLDTALDYGYQSAEAFNRAFIRVWGMPPHKYAKSRRFSGLYPKLDFPRKTEYKGEIIMTNKFDITELYDYIRSKEGKYVICFDTCHLDVVNREYGRKAGDAQINECLRRIEEVCEDGMLMFRIGGDEYALVTDSDDPEQVKDIAARALAHNGETVEVDGTVLPVSMRAGALKLSHESCRRYQILFDELASTPSNDPDKFNINA